MVVLDVPDAVVLKRVTGRRIDPVSGRIYHIEHKPPETPEIAARLFQRSDDTVEKMRRRLEGFHSNLASINQFYAAMEGTCKGLMFMQLYAGGKACVSAARGS